MNKKDLKIIIKQIILVEDMEDARSFLYELLQRAYDEVIQNIEEFLDLIYPNRQVDITDLCQLDISEIEYDINYRIVLDELFDFLKDNTLYMNERYYFSTGMMKFRYDFFSGMVSYYSCLEDLISLQITFAPGVE